MQEINVGAQIADEGLQFFGLDELNALIQAGHRVVRIDPGQVLVEEIDEDELEEDEEEGVALVGFELNVVLEP